MDSQKLKAYRRLKELLTEAEPATYEWENDDRFDSWMLAAKGAFRRLFGDESHHMQAFATRDFQKHLRTGNRSPSFYEDTFQRRFSTVRAHVRSAVEDFEELENHIPAAGATTMKEVFISHSSIDKEVVFELVNILEAMKISHEQIHCSSKHGYGTPFGDNFITDIRDKLSGETLVLFVLSDNFYESPICMCEMGAAWAFSSKQIPIVVAPFDFDKVKGVFPHTHGLKINDRKAMTVLKDQIKPLFEIENDHPDWEEKRDAAISMIDEKLRTAVNLPVPQPAPQSSGQSKKSLNSAAIAILRCFAKRDTDELSQSDIKLDTGLSYIDVKLALTELKQAGIANIHDDNGYVTVAITDDVGLKAVSDERRLLYPPRKPAPRRR